MIKKNQGKKHSAFFCRRESGKNQIMSAFTSAIADCRRELKRLKLCDKIGHPVVSLIESQWKLRQQHDQMEGKPWYNKY